MVYGLEVGAIVTLPSRPDWGLGQVQSIVGVRVTVNFEHHGKTILIGPNVDLELVSGDVL